MDVNFVPETVAAVAAEEAEAPHCPQSVMAFGTPVECYIEI